VTADVLYFLCAGGTGVLVAYKYRAWRRAPAQRRATILPVWASGIFVAAAYLFTAPTIGEPLNSLTGIPSVSILLVSLFATAYICSAQIMLWYWLRPQQQAWGISRWLLLAYGTVAAAMIVLFALGPRSGAHHLDFLAVYPNTPFLAEFVAIHYFAFSVGISTVLYICWRWSNDPLTAEKPWLRRGLRITSTGLVGSVTYSVTTLVAVVIGWFGPNTTAWTATIAPLFSALGLPFVIVGMSIPTWGPTLSAARDWVTAGAGDARDYWRLRRLWRALKEVDATMVHRHHGIGDWISVRSRLFWRVIEINDWLQRLRHYHDPAVAALVERHGQDTGLSTENRLAAHEAAQIKVALLARTRGVTPSAGPAAARRDEPEPTHYAFASERSRLILVAHAFTSPLINTVLQQQQSELAV
jgi:hypothetical protein